MIYRSFQCIFRLYVHMLCFDRNNFGSCLILFYVLQSYSYIMLLFAFLCTQKSTLKGTSKGNLQGKRKEKGHAHQTVPIQVLEQVIAGRMELIKRHGTGQLNIFYISFQFEQDFSFWVLSNPNCPPKVMEIDKSIFVMK